MTLAITSKIKTLLAVGLVAAFASPAFAGPDVEGNPIASGRYVAGAPGPYVPTLGMAHAQATQSFAGRHDTADWRLFERAVGSIR